MIYDSAIRHLSNEYRNTVKNNRSYFLEEIQITTVEFYSKFVYEYKMLCVYIKLEKPITFFQDTGYCLDAPELIPSGGCSNTSLLFSLVQR